MGEVPEPNDSCGRCRFTLLLSADLPFLQVGWPLPPWRGRPCMMPGAVPSSLAPCPHFKEREVRRWKT